MEALREATPRPPTANRRQVRRAAQRPAGTPQALLPVHAIDDCTCLRIYPKSDQKTTIQFLDYVLSRFPFQVEKIQTDNGAEFQSAFHWHTLDEGIGHVYIRPATPRLNGKAERSHRIDAEEFYRLLDGVVIGDAEVFNERLKEWRTATTTTAHTAASAARPRMRGCYSRPHPRLGCQRPASVAHYGATPGSPSTAHD
ncbi:hypothetical protein [Lentzea sp.]|uniref:hypothetical protein n=1 Tax=Lentzea sp. TaxID=56099 RepID=UPI002ED5CFCE